MPARKADYAGTTWEDIAQCIPSWEAEHGVRVRVQIEWRPNLSHGAYVEVVLCDMAPSEEFRELYRVRAPFPTRKASGQAGAVLHAAFQAFHELDSTPWAWSLQMRRDRVK